MGSCIAFILVAAALTITGLGNLAPINLRSSASPPNVPVKFANVSDMLDGKLQSCPLVVEGTIRDAFRDETNPGYFWLVLTSSNETFYASADTSTWPDFGTGTQLMSIIGAHVAITGVCDPNAKQRRPYKGYTLEFMSIADIRILVPAPRDPFNVEAVGDLSHLRPQAIPAVGRRRLTGRVLATWKNHFLLESQLMLLPFHGGKQFPQRNIALVKSVGSIPKTNSIVDAVGFPETDNCNINLVNAQWRYNKTARPDYPLSEPTNLTAQTILTDNQGRPSIKQELHGTTVRLEGVVRTVVRDASSLQLDDGTDLVTIVLSGIGDRAHELTIGSRIEVTGACVLDVDTWRPNAAFPRIKGFFLVTRGPDDVRVLATPSWWTVRRLLAVIGGLTALLLGILVWNFALRRMVERRSRELVEERTQTLRADLKVEERTRLAVELHDSIAQSLSGVVMEVETAERLGAGGPADMRQHLTLASRALKSCNDDLRNCLWDLRCQALEEKDMTTAIEKTLKPHATAAQLAVRFNVAREKLADQTAYSVLRIVRELVINAIRHGKASRVRIAGSLDYGTLRFSVTDDGRGFDPDACPGVAQGHFGIEGIRERVDQLGGTFDLVSSPGRGTKAVITLASFEET